MTDPRIVECAKAAHISERAAQACILRWLKYEVGQPAIESASNAMRYMLTTGPGKFETLRTGYAAMCSYAAKEISGREGE